MIFQIVFIMNQIATISEVDDVLHSDGEIYYIARLGLLICALIKAKNRIDAELKAKEIIAEVNCNKQ